MPTIYRKTMTLKDFLSQNDRFAANSGCILKEVREGYARAELVVTSEHLNAGGVCQGGAYFTLADIALAAVMNSRGTLTFGIENNMSAIPLSLKLSRCSTITRFPMSMCVSPTSRASSAVSSRGWHIEKPPIFRSTAWNNLYDGGLLDLPADS